MTTFKRETQTGVRLIGVKKVGLEAAVQFTPRELQIIPNNFRLSSKEVPTTKIPVPGALRPGIASNYQ